MSHSKLDRTSQRVSSAWERSRGMSHSRLATIACGVVLLGSASAWLPYGVTTAARAAAGTRAHRGERRQAAALSPLKSSNRDGVERPDLAALKKGFEQSMDGKLVMEYVTELRSRKALLVSLLEGTGGIITEDIYPIMEDLALVNPSGGCGKGGDQGRGHYCAMLPGHWIAASTLVPNVPYVYGKGETKPSGSSSSSSSSSSSPSGGAEDGPTCTLGELVAAITGRSCSGDFDPSTPVRPLRARLSALNNTVKDREMPTVVTVAGFSPAAIAVPAAPALGKKGKEKQEKGGTGSEEGGGEEEEKEEEEEEEEEEESRANVAGKDDVAEALAAAISSADQGPRAAAAAGGAGVRAEGFGRSADDVTPATPAAPSEDGAVRGRGQWGVKGGYHLRWEFDTMNVDLGGDKISGVEAVGGPGGGGWGGRDLYEFFLDQNMFIVAWKGNSPKAEDAVVFLREEVPR